MKSIYETFLEEYQGSKTQTYKVIEEFYNLLKGNNFKYSDEVYKYINKTVDQVR
jgi:ribosomal protein L19E